MNDVTYTAYLRENLKLSKSGTWYHNGIEFSNPKVIDLFNHSIVWDAEHACYVVRIGRQQAVFECEDTAYFVTELLDTVVPWQVNISNGTCELLRQDTIRIGAENQFYCLVNEHHRARFSRSAHQTLLQHAISEDTIRINGKELQLPTDFV